MELVCKGSLETTTVGPLQKSSLCSSAVGGFAAMQHSWTNPFVRGKINWQSCAGDLSDDDDSCPDQVIYHEDHLENLFGLYNRSEEAKPKCQGPSQIELVEADLGSQKNHFLPTLPSARETAIWDALEASNSSFQEALHAPQYDSERCWSDGAPKLAVEEHIFEAPLEDGLTEDLEDVNFAIGSTQLATGSGEVPNDVKGDKVKPKDAWDCVSGETADFDDIHDYMSATRAKNHCFPKQHKGTYKKKLNFNFRPMSNVSSVHHGVEQRDEQPKLSLAQQLQSLAETDGPLVSRMKLQNGPKYMTPCTNVPITERLLDLVRQDSQLKSDKKARKFCNQKVNSFKRLVKVENISEGDDTIDHRDERDSDATGASILNAKLPSTSINDEFRKALLAAPPASMEDLNRQGKIFGFAARLQKVLERERNDRASFLKMLQSKHDLQDQTNCMEVEVISKSLEARLAACVCKVLKQPEPCLVEVHGTQENTDTEIMVIFNMQINAQLELEVGSMVRLYPPWQEFLNAREFGKTLLCTYFCELLAKS